MLFDVRRFDVNKLRHVTTYHRRRDVLRASNLSWQRFSSSFCENDEETNLSFFATQTSAFYFGNATSSEQTITLIYHDSYPPRPNHELDAFDYDVVANRSYPDGTCLFEATLSKVSCCHNGRFRVDGILCDGIHSAKAI
jgi:hypothetical protein